MTTPEAPANPFATHPNEDPDHLAARQSRIDFAAKAEEIRNAAHWSDSYKAEQLAELYQEHVQEVAGAYERVTERRRARLDYLTSLVPSGPGIPDDVSPADRAVLIAAFRTALDTAKAAPREQRGRLLAEAARYGDTAMQRAVLQHASDSGDVHLVNSWVAETHGVRGFSDEKRQLTSALNSGPGKGGWSGWDFKDFHTPPVPPEVARAVSP
ncbi:hypothetical protein OG266_39470 [Streptomyces sp. NBC_00554]|uniref:hypothetical protein n=1 Tax=Streptomyces sp. NBC_00554 TaxID=2903661 RepID=UPI00352C3DCA|nr:hypothetical protein OG266_39470 [Streptomyces sp. NBC_00554]